MKVRYSRRALAQLEQVHSYIFEHNPSAARRVVERIEDLCEKLGEFPGMGHTTDHPDIRVLPVVRYPYLIFYMIVPDEDSVRILRIRHGRRRPMAPTDEWKEC